MAAVYVKTKQELQKAYDAKAETIIVTGKLAKDLKKAQKVKKLGPAAIASLAAAAATVGVGAALTPVTGGLSAGISALAAMPAVISISTETGVAVAVIVVAVSIGISLVSAIFKEYDVEFTVEHGNTKATFHAHKNK